MINIIFLIFFGCILFVSFTTVHCSIQRAKFKKMERELLDIFFRLEKIKSEFETKVGKERADVLLKAASLKRLQSSQLN